MVSDLTVEREVLIDAPADLVWRNITDPERIRLWFADRVELDPRPGGSGKFYFDEQSFEATVVVEISEPPQRFSFRWCHPHGEEPTELNSVLVEFELASIDDSHTRLRVTESGFEGMTWSEQEKRNFADEHRRGWALYLARLAELAVDSPIG